MIKFLFLLQHFRHPDLNAKIGRTMREYSAALRSKYSTPPELSTHAPLPLPSGELMCLHLSSLHMLKMTPSFY